MPQKFMLIAVAGYVLCASLAAVLTTSTTKSGANPHRLTIMLLHWSAALVFVVASLPNLLVVATPFSVNALWPVPRGIVLTLAGAALLTYLYWRPDFRGWWSPLPWLRGVLMATGVTAWAGASQGARHALLPDWRFIGTSLVLWAVCLILADLALISSRSSAATEPSGRMVRELLRLCAALPALLVYLIGIRI